MHDGDEMKPVAWNIKENREAYREDNPNDIVALYTAPRELSDEEIEEIINSLICTADKNWNVEFAKAILKKASEK
jgi:hypothetical protein